MYVYLNDETNATFYTFKNQIKTGPISLLYKCNNQCSEARTFTEINISSP